MSATLRRFLEAFAEPPQPPGQSEGERCNLDGCPGTIEIIKRECSCRICTGEPPCTYLGCSECEREIE